MEFALDFEWRVPDGAHFLMDRRDRDWGNRSLKPIDPINRVTSYGMPSRDGLSKVFELIHDDIGSSCGVSLPLTYPINFEQAVESMLQA